jgi:hypothetical protein
MGTDVGRGHVFLLVAFVSFVIFFFDCINI